MYQAFELVEWPEYARRNIIRHKGYNPASQPDAPLLDIYIDFHGRLGPSWRVSRQVVSWAHIVCISESQGGTHIQSDTIPYDGGMNYRYEQQGVITSDLFFGRVSQPNSLVLSPHRLLNLL